MIVDASGEQRLPLPAGTQGITWSPDASQIAYVVYVPTHGYTISSLDLATGESTMQVRGIGVAGGVRWSPDGNRIAYQAPMGLVSEIFVYELDSAVLRPEQVTQGLGAFDPEWTPDGERLIVSALTETQTYEIYELDPATGEVSQITNSSDIYKRLPRFSPDGGTIAYTGSIIVPTVSRIAASLHSFGVFLMNSDGSNERALTADPRLNPGQGVDPFLDAILIGWCRPGPWLDDTWTLGDPQASPVIQ